MPPQPFLSGPALSLPWCLVWYLNIFPPTLLIPFFLAIRLLGVCFIRAILPHWKYLEHKLLATLLNRSAHVGATSHTLALDWLEALMPCADLIASKQWSFSLWQLNSLDIFQKSKFTIPNFQINVIFFSFFFLFTIVMLFVGELLDVNIKKEISEEVMDLEANVSNIFSLNLNMGAIQEDRMT